MATCSPGEIHDKPINIAESPTPQYHLPPVALQGIHFGAYKKLCPSVRSVPFKEVIPVYSWIKEALLLGI